MPVADQAAPYEIADLPASLGQKASAASLPVVMASDQARPYVQVTPLAYGSLDADSVVPGSEIDARAFSSLAYTIAIATNGVTWTVFGANAAGYTDEVAVNGPAAVAAAAIGSYAVAQAPYAYYRVKVKSTVGGATGVATLRGIVKG